jgi:hypothetical protein
MGFWFGHLIDNTGQNRGLGLPWSWELGKLFAMLDEDPIAPCKSESVKRPKAWSVKKRPSDVDIAIMHRRKNRFYSKFLLAGEFSPVIHAMPKHQSGRSDMRKRRQVIGDLRVTVADSTNSPSMVARWRALFPATPQLYSTCRRHSAASATYRSAPPLALDH